MLVRIFFFSISSQWGTCWSKTDKLILFPTQKKQKNCLGVFKQYFFFLSGHSRSLKSSKTIIFAYLCFHDCHYEASPCLRCYSSTNRNQYSSASTTQLPNVAPKPKNWGDVLHRHRCLGCTWQFRSTGLAHWNVWIIIHAYYLSGNSWN